MALHEQIKEQLEIVTQLARLQEKEPTASSNSCNLHVDCAAADLLAKQTGQRLYADHCHDDCCEDCFGY